MSDSNFNFQYPQTLCDLWCWVHHKPVTDQSTIQSNADFSNAYETLWNKLTEFLVKSTIPGINHDENAAKDAASDYITYLMLQSGPEAFTSESYLRNDCRKYLARKNNPVQYELNEILREALHDLERLGKIKRDSASVGKIRYQQKLTMFALPTCKNDESMVADQEDYLANKHKVHSYTTTARGGDFEKTKIITPTDAKSLVLELLDAFGSWVRMDDLMRAMQNHIPEQMQEVYSMYENNPEQKTDPIENIPDETYDGEEYMDSYTIEAVRIKTWQLSEILWEKICAISTQTFCLYYLPNTLFQKNVSARTLGASSTISDQNDKLRKVFMKVVGNYMSENGNGLTKLIMRMFPKLFLHRCTEIGYKPDLSTSVNKERN